MDLEQERLKILEMIDAGQISAQEGIRLLNALSGNDDLATAPAEQIEPAEAAPDPLPEPAAPPTALPAALPAAMPDEPAEAPHAESTPPEAESVPFESDPEVLPPRERFDPSQLRWRDFWWIPMWVGVGIMVVGALLMYWAWSASGFGFWFACTWFPFLLGVAVMALAWSSRTARWLHLRVHQKPGEKPERIAISFPIPLRLTAWLLRTFGNKIPHMENSGLDEVILALDATSPEAPFYLEVNEGEDGERVEIYIG